jgi:hypothetical protein
MILDKGETRKWASTKHAARRTGRGGAGRGMVLPWGIVGGEREREAAWMIERS